MCLDHRIQRAELKSTPRHTRGAPGTLSLPPAHAQGFHLYWDFSHHRGLPAPTCTSCQILPSPPAHAQLLPDTHLGILGHNTACQSERDSHILPGALPPLRLLLLPLSGWCHSSQKQLAP